MKPNELFEKIWKEIMSSDKPFKLPFNYKTDHRKWLYGWKKFIKKCRLKGYDGDAETAMKWYELKLK